MLQPAARTACTNPAMHSAALVEHWEDPPPASSSRRLRSWNSASSTMPPISFLGTQRTSGRRTTPNAREALLMKTAPGNPLTEEEKQRLRELSAPACPIRPAIH